MTGRNNFAVIQRQRMIDLLLHLYGRVNRAALEEYFGISTPQASLDLQRYLQEYPGNAVYDKSAKAYVRSETFVRGCP